MNVATDIIVELQQQFGAAEISPQPTSDGMPTCWVGASKLKEILRHLKGGIDRPFSTLYDLFAVDERKRAHRDGMPPADFTVVYHLLSYERTTDLRIKVALVGELPSIPSITDVWPSADWYEREAWDMFGIAFEGHPNLRRILMPPWWKGHPLRKEHPSRATEIGPFQLPEDVAAEQDQELRFKPEDWGWTDAGGDFDHMILNVGPQHPGTHGLLRVVCRLDGQEIEDVVTDIGFHHRGAEKLAERQSWNAFIPYTDRIDYLGGVMNELPYLMALETLAGIQVPDRAKVVRIMLSELFRVISHLVYYGTLVQDVGAITPVFFTFNDRERALDIVEAIAGGRMHPSWFRIGGIAQDLPQGWDKMIGDFLAYMPKRLAEYDKLVLRSGIFKKRTQGVGDFTIEEGKEWGATGPMLRSAGLAWDLRKNRPYGGYDQFEFDVPVGVAGDVYDRTFVHVEEMRQSLRIIAQCLEAMPSGPYMADYPPTPPGEAPRKGPRGPSMPVGEASFTVETIKGNTTYYVISDGGLTSYRTRIRTPSFAHVQMLPLLSKGFTIADFVAIIGSLDYVLADIDR